MAIVADVGGAAIGVWQPGHAPGLRRLGEPGTPTGSSCTPATTTPTVGFYEDVFKWDTHVDRRHPRVPLHDARRRRRRQLAGIMDASGIPARRRPPALVDLLRRRRRRRDARQGRRARRHDRHAGRGHAVRTSRPGRRPDRGLVQDRRRILTQLALRPESHAVSRSTSDRPRGRWHRRCSRSLRTSTTSVTGHLAAIGVPARSPRDPGRRRASVRCPLNERVPGGSPMSAVAAVTAAASRSSPATGTTSALRPSRRTAGPNMAVAAGSVASARRACTSVASASPKNRSVTCQLAGGTQRTPGWSGRGSASSCSMTCAGGHTAMNSRAIP